ncbi:MAG: EAL domain-containing protein [Butyrivibrio sp.]|jgi:diguanylate cyclase (GGDEF)-like protein|nr:EAL domain-containing protein [Butyrivibrio sp.]
MTKYTLVQKLRVVFIVLSVLSLIASLLLLRQFVTKNSEEYTVDQVRKVYDPKHRVLLLSSYNPFYYTYVHHIDGLQPGLYDNQVDYDVMFMDAKSFNSADDIRAFHDYIKYRLDNDNKYDGILVADDDALEFSIRYQHELFDGIPIVFFGINNYSLAVKASSIAGMSGFYEDDYTLELVELARKLMPERKIFYGLHDNSAAGNADRIVFNGLGNKFEDCEFNTINICDMNKEEFKQKLRSIPENAICIYMTCFTNNDGYTYSIEEMSNIVTDNVKAPVFRNHIADYTDGCIAGMAISFEEQCYDAALLMCDVLDGADINDYELDVETPQLVEADYNILAKYGISMNKLPAGSHIHNRPSNLLSVYGDLLPFAGLMLLSLVFITLAVTAVAVHEKQVNTELLESKERIEKSRENLKYQADHDELLDIYNRRYALEYLKTYAVTDMKYTVMMLDIDNFKDINEVYGHSSADFYLQTITYRIKDYVRDKDWMLARYGGDEFILWIPDKELGEDSSITQDLLGLFREPIKLDKDTIVSSCSIGISVSDGFTRPEIHIINAEIAMYEAKNKGRNRAILHSEEMKKRVTEENEIKAKLVNAMDNDGFYMLYQPQIDAKTKEITGYEALVRMYEKGMYPGVFIPVAENNGWINRIGRIVTELVIKQIAKWRDEGYALHPVSINFSRNQIYDAGYVSFLKGLLDQYEVPSKFIEIEVTEGLFLERTQQAEALFEQFINLGIRLHMDDFGTGYSSLGYLTYIPVEIVKLDKSLVDAYLVEGKDSFIRDVIQLVHDLNKVIIIEGVEEKWQYERLKEFDADIIQGYYFSKPIEAEEAIVFSASDK